MNILVTGSSGQIGSRFISHLLNTTDHHIRALSRDKTPNIVSDRLDNCTGDIMVRDSLDQAVKNIDAVIHLAGITHTSNPSQYYAVNLIGIENLILMCEQYHVKKFVNIGSRSAGENAGAYARSKYLAERRLEASNLPWVTLRIGEVYGEKTDTAISKIVRLVKKSWLVPIIGDGSYTICPVHIEDVVQCIAAAVELDPLPNRIYTVAGPREFTYEEFIDQVSKYIRVNRLKLHLPISLMKLIGYISRLFGVGLFVSDQIPRLLSKKSCDISMAGRDLNFKPRQFFSTADASCAKDQSGRS